MATLIPANPSLRTPVRDEWMIILLPARSLCDDDHGML
jgi:hypothetical protein